MDNLHEDALRCVRSLYLDELPRHAECRDETKDARTRIGHWFPAATLVNYASKGTLFSTGAPSATYRCAVVADVISYTDTKRNIESPSLARKAQFCRDGT
ncbi:hypothetical protein PG987_007576 [Apiospora arundinis]|uniref:Uncharacterized protein n=1 Tax=Apiospora arundinis TaxID=335852 RepID=A0ABR2I5S2_9PEZI